MRTEYFRIVELPTAQVLISKDFDSDEEKPLIAITFYFEGVRTVQSFGYDDEEKRDEMFLKITDEQIKDTFDRTSKMFQ